jgi:hypothetical protein
VLQDEVDRRSDVPDRGLAGDNRRIGFGLVGHLGRPRGFAVAAQIEKPHVVAARGDVFHPGHAIELEVERRLGRVGRAVHVEHGLLRPERGHVRRSLVADVNFDAGI